MLINLSSVLNRENITVIPKACVHMPTQVRAPDGTHRLSTEHCPSICFEVVGAGMEVEVGDVIASCSSLPNLYLHQCSHAPIKSQLKSFSQLTPFSASCSRPIAPFKLPHPRLPTPLLRLKYHHLKRVYVVFEVSEMPWSRQSFHSFLDLGTMFCSLYIGFHKGLGVYEYIYFLDERTADVSSSKNSSHSSHLESCKLEIHMKLHYTIYTKGLLIN